jgi:ABC-2 type transport system permease protein
MTHALALGWDRTVLELKMYSREKESVFFSFLFPIMLLALFATIFSAQFGDPQSQADGMTAGRYFLPGMISAGVLLTSFQTMALSVATERDDGTLKRLRSTPMPPVAYFLGKVGLVGITSLAQMAVLLLVARVGYDVPMPTDGGRWWAFAWVFVLGVFGGTVLGVAYSSLASARSAGAVVIGPILVLQFISGVYISFTEIPTWLQQIASVFPLKWIAQGMRSVFLPESMAAREMAGGWEPGRTALVLALWAVGGLVLCVRTFRWYKRGTV